VAVVAPPEELDEVVVLRERLLQFAHDRPFGALLDPQLAVEGDLVGDVEQLRLAVDPDGVQHRLRLRGGVRRERCAGPASTAAHCPPPLGRCTRLVVRVSSRRRVCILVQAAAG